MNSIADKVREASRCFGSGDVAGAERLCGEILSAAPGHPETLHLLGVVRLMSGNAADAISLIGQALEASPQDASMLEHLGVAHLAGGDAARAEVVFRRALARNAAHGLLHMRLGLALGAQGKLAEAVHALREAAARSPGEAEIHLNLGNALAGSGQLEEALECYRKVLGLRPSHAAARYNIGNAYREMGRLDEAAAAFRRLLEVTPGDPDAHNNLGIVYERQGRLEEAASCYRKALELGPAHVPARNNLGNILVAQDRAAEAAAWFQQAIDLEPSHPDAYVNMGNLRAAQGAYEEALALYRRALSADPRTLEAHRNLARIYSIKGDASSAVHHQREALSLNPGMAALHNELGNAHAATGDLAAAADSYRRAIAIAPRHPDAQFNLAEIHKLEGKLDQAIAGYRATLEANPDYPLALGGLVHLRQHACDWDGIDNLWQRLRQKIADDAGGSITPFGSLSLPTTADEQLAVARAWARREFATVSMARPQLAFDFSSRARTGRLRVGYLSWGFHRHATAHLAAGLFELHDRTRFEVFAYAYGPDDGSEIRARMRKASEHFLDVSAEAYATTAKRIYDDGIDILVDLTGYTLGARTQILALRPAPVQVNWLGYPGTMGSDCVDYIVADHYIIPAGEEGHYAETVIRLPHCYQLNDHKRQVDERVPGRRDYGLPEKGFVFCCFNQAYKVLPETFSLWMGVIHAVPGSVLWLADANPWASENLRREAAARDIAPERLVFAARKPLPEYLASYRVADLALDTFPYTSHTTASDALWMGCPLVTRAGDTFASRVAGSILTSAGLPQLIARSPAEYERLAVDIALSGERLAELRNRLREDRERSPLFDSPQLVRDLEAAYERMVRNVSDGRPLHS